MQTYILKFCVLVILLSLSIATSPSAKSCLLPADDRLGEPHLIPLTKVPAEILDYVKAEKTQVKQTDFVCATVQEYDKTVYMVQFTDGSLRQMCTAKAEFLRTEKYHTEIICFKNREGCNAGDDDDEQ